MFKQWDIIVWNGEDVVSGGIPVISNGEEVYFSAEVDGKITAMNSRNQTITINKPELVSLLTPFVDVPMLAFRQRNIKPFSAEA